jgi:iron complex outermembrane receptor protein
VFDYSRSEFVSPTFQVTEATDLTDSLFEIPFSRDRLDSLATKDQMRPSDSSIDGHALTITRDWDRHTFKSITSYREFEYYEFANLESGSASELLYLNGNRGIELTGERGSLLQDQFSQEFQFQGSAGATFDYVTGFYYFKEEADRDFAQASLVLVPQPGEINDIDVENEAWAVYAQSNWTPDVLDSRFTLTTGIRYTEDDRYAARMLTLVPDTDDRSFDAEPEDDFQNVSYTLVGNWAFTDDINGYLKLATGYKSGGYNIRASNEASYVRGFDEETITTLELGLKSELWDRRVRLNAAIYYSLWEDMQLNLADTSTPADVRDTNVINAGESEINGLELDITAILTEGLTLSASYAYLDTEFTEVDAPDNPEVSEDDFVFSNAPEHQYTLGLNYYRPLNFGGLTASLNYYWVDDRFDTQKKAEAEDGSTVIDSYGLLGAFLGLSEIELGAAGSLDINLWGRNLTDEEYFTSAPVILQPAGAYHKGVTWGLPRTYGVDFIYRFSR